MRNIYHLGYIPKSLLAKEPEYVVSALETVLKKFHPVCYDDVERLFEKYTKKQLKLFFGSHPNLASYLQRYSNIFKIDLNTKIVTVLEGRGPRKIGEMPVPPERKYLEFANSNACLSTDNNTRLSSANSFAKGVTEEKKNSMVINETINLEEDLKEILDKNNSIDLNYDSFEDEI